MSTSVPETSDTDRPAASDAPSDGSRILAGRYLVGKRIGAGGMATIVSARDRQMDRDVAIKVLHRHLAGDPQIQSRFKAEARHAASLTHPNIVAVFDQGQSDLPYIVMEMVAGPSLRQVLGRHGPLSPEQLLAVIPPLADALQSAHDGGLVHRDIKPENVLITPEGIPKLADFGIARVMAATSHTATGSLVGSVHYMAPELVGGIEATPASDQYALAVMAFELLTGRKPLTGDTPMAIALRHAKESVPPPSRYAPEVPAALDAVIERATRHDPTRRYPTVRAMAAAMLAAVGADAQEVATTQDDGSIHTLILPPEASETMAITATALAEQERAERDLAERRGPREEPGTATRISTPARPTAVRPAAVPTTPPPRRRTGRRVLVVLLWLVLLAGLGAGGGYVYWDQVVAPVAAVPDLRGMDSTEAQQRLSDLGLLYRVQGEENRLDAPAGSVIAQDPSDGELRAGNTVAVTLSLGPLVVDMPSFEGRTVEDIGPEVQANSFVLEDPTETFDDAVPAGQIISQSPEEGLPVEQGSAVSVVVSLGIEQVTVPDLAGQTQEASEQLLAEAQLTLGEVTTTFSDEVPEAGLLVSQSLDPAVQVDKNSPVSLVFSQGPLTIEVPDVRGLSPDEATAELEALGLVVERITEEQRTFGPFTVTVANVVQGSVPERGEPIQRGSTVQIFYFTEAAVDDDDDDDDDDD
ncbi:Stk1 family PASTA domain-containing Ser/Thr kinase [Euzebya tangerina]|uniref:Stk1 family PASTA domain-containing Ser/Thr kinase n=1 Tax=Euzebya tangerina TaxID=591198 RepID=UPI0013C2F0B1|nr:Stk1 family PASTA domain-containing Ser/Thr kinase [Euzebya tangerina]